MAYNTRLATRVSPLILGIGAGVEKGDVTENRSSRPSCTWLLCPGYGASHATVAMGSQQAGQMALTSAGEGAPRTSARRARGCAAPVEIRAWVGNGQEWG